MTEAVDTSKAGPVDRQRRTLRLEAELGQARAAGAQVLLTGPAVHDLFIDPDGKVVFLPDMVKSWCVRYGLGLITYSILAGATSYPTLPDGSAIDVGVKPRTGNAAPGDHPADELLTIIADMRQAGHPAVLLFDYADLLLPDYDDSARGLQAARLVEQLQTVTSDVRGWQRLGLQLFLVDRGGGVLRRLIAQAGIRTVTVEPPDAAESTVYFEKAVAAADPANRLHLAQGLSAKHAGRIGGGLLLRDFDADRVISSPERPVTAERIAGQKSAAIRARSNGTLDLLNAAVDLDRDVAGMHALRLYVRDSLRKRRTLRVALCGPPGTGKTYSASALANLLGVPMVSFGQVLGEYLGQSERNMRTAWALIDAMSPVLVFEDEADQGLLGARGRSGHTGNEAYGTLRATMFNKLGEPHTDNGISMVITTNVPTRLDARTQARFTFMPVLFAAGPDLARIMQIHARAAGITLDGDPTDVLTAYTDTANVLSGRSAQEVLVDAEVLAAEDGRNAVTPRDVQAAIDQRLDRDWNDEAEYSTLASLCHPSSTRRLPWVAAALLGENYPIPGYLRPYLDGEGVPDLNKVRGRLAELEARNVWG